jgi:hypothetical protein
MEKVGLNDPTVPCCVAEVTTKSPNAAVKIDPSDPMFDVQEVIAVGTRNYSRLDLGASP